MYKCIFIKYLWKDTDKKRKFKTLQKEVELPFPPAIGMEVTDAKWFSGKIERVVWNNEDNVFSVKVMDIQPKEGVTAELLLDVATNQGWTPQD